VEITPKSLRVRKRLLNETDRLRNRKREKAFA
jgi:predicted membrane GTPase involved in stress response